jgi:hypothetical protein
MMEGKDPVRSGELFRRKSQIGRRRRVDELARKKQKEPRVAAVDAPAVLMRDLRGTFLWTGIAIMVTAVLALIGKTMF